MKERRAGTRKYLNVFIDADVISAAKEAATESEKDHWRLNSYVERVLREATPKARKAKR